MNEQRMGLLLRTMRETILTFWVEELLARGVMPSEAVLRGKQKAGQAMVSIRDGWLKLYWPRELADEAPPRDFKAAVLALLRQCEQN